MKIIVAGSGVGELALHFLDRLGIAVVKVLSKFDLRRLCRVVNATPLARMGPPTPEEAAFVDVMVVVVRVDATRRSVTRASKPNNSTT